MGDGSIWTGIVAAVPPVAAGGWAFWKWYQDWRRDNPRRGSWEEREAASIEKARELLDRRSEAYVDRLEREGDELRYDRDRGWNLARFWEGTAHDLRHQLINALFAAGKTEMPPPLPGLEDPEPRRASP